jgi:hypothetical protein
MLYKIICTQKDCANEGIQYLMPNPHAEVMCGGCKEMIAAVETNIPEPETPDYSGISLFSE